jgi:Senescence-associated protein
MVTENLEVLIEIPEVLRISISADGTRYIEEQAPLQVLYYPERDAVILRHEDFIYSLDKNLPVFTNTRPTDCFIGKRYVVSMGKEQKALVLSKHIDSNQQKSFEEVINQYAVLYFANDGNEPEWIEDTVYANDKLADQIHKSNFFGQAVKLEQKKEDKSISKQVGNFLSFAGDMMMTGLTKAGEFLGEGIRHSSSAIKKLVGKNEKPVKLEPTTIGKVRSVNRMTKTVTTFSKQQIANVIDFSVELGKQAKDEFFKTEKGKNVSNNKYFIHAANVGGGAFDFFVGIYSGLENAFTSVAQGTKGMTESVLEHKYGSDVKEVFSEGTNAAWEVYQMKGMVRREVLKKTGNVIQDELHDSYGFGSGTKKPQTKYPIYAPNSVQIPANYKPPVNGSWNMNAK